MSLPATVYLQKFKLINPTKRVFPDWIRPILTRWPTFPAAAVNSEASL